MQSLTDMFMNSSKHNEHSEGMEFGKDGSGGGSGGSSSLIHSNLSDVNHVKQLSLDIGNLFNNTDYCDVVLVVDGVEFKAHKIILAARSDYFRALLFSGMRETNSDRIEITAAARPAAFKLLLQYIYTGKILLRNEKEEPLIDLLGLVHQYGFVELQKSISNYLESILDLRNVCQIYNISSMYQLKSLEETCARFIDRNCQLLIKQNTLLQLSCESLASIISRDSFSASEIDIFNLVREWHEANGVKEPRQDLIDKIRLPLMKMEELLNEVRQSTLIDPNTILDAIKVQRESNSMSLRYRGILYPNENVATPRLMAQVVKGDFKPALLDGDVKNYDLDRGFTYHPIDENVTGGSNQHSIVVRLGAPTIFNQIKLLLWDRDLRSYSYYVEVSMDEKDWQRVCDYSDYMCRSWQNLVFKPVVARYIQVTGVRNTANRIFHLVSMEVRYTTERYELSSCHSHLIEPHFNVATVGKGAVVLEGVSRTKNALINGDFKNYDWDSGYTCHQLGNGSISIQLAQPYVLGSLRLLLWDCDNRSYSYFIETSLDQSNWFMVADKRNEESRSWQVIVFKPRPVSFIRITGTHNTANEVFHCVHFEAPCDPFILSRFVENNNNNNNFTNSSNNIMSRVSNPINISPLSMGAGGAVNNATNNGANANAASTSSGLHNLNNGEWRLAFNNNNNNNNFQANSVANSAFSVTSSHSMSSSLNATTCSIVNTDSNVNNNNSNVMVVSTGNNVNTNNTAATMMTNVSQQQQQQQQQDTNTIESSFQFDSLIDDLIVAANRERDDNDTASTYSEMNEN